MSKDDEKERDPEQGFTVKDKRRFTIDGDGSVVNRSKEEGTETKQAETKAEPNSSETQEETRSNGSISGECEEKLKDLPPMTFSTLVLSLSTQAMISLGQIPDPMTQEINQNIALAKQTIDLLGILDEKTKGNLSKEEESFLKQSLTDLRLLFVQRCKG